jgi:hypothetical protein
LSARNVPRHRHKSWHDDARLGIFAANGDDGIEPAHLWHLQIHQGDIRAVRAELLDPFPSVGGLGDHSHVRFSRDKRGNAPAD